MRSIEEVNFKEIIKNRSYHPSPLKWEDETLYFLLVDRFSNGQEKNLYNPDTDYENALKNEESKQQWLEQGDKWLGGTLQGLKSKLGYLKELGITAIWMSPILKQVAFENSYHGYGIQNFLAIDPHFGNEQDLKELVEEAHKLGIYVIMDIILNHTGNVFTYDHQSPNYTEEQYPIKAFNDKTGAPTIPVEFSNADELDMDSGIWPVELMTPDTFSRKGQINNWDNDPEYIEGDFFSLKNIHTGEGEYNNFNPSEALKIITECYKYWIAVADLDGFRLDTVKHLYPGATRYFMTEIHEFTQSIGKNNFYVFGEVTGGMEFAIKMLDITGIDAALGINKIPDKLENVAKGYLDPDEFFNIFKNSDLLGEDENKWYKDNVVTMFDDHDMVVQGGQKSRFCSDKETAGLLLNALFLNLMSPGIPCIYYGTEQAFDGAGDGDKFVRETMFESDFGAFRSRGKHFFDQENNIYQELSKLNNIRQGHQALSQGRVYQRQISYDNNNFELPHKLGEGRHTGIISWARIFNQEEFILIINCNITETKNITTMVDGTLHQPEDEFNYIYSTDGQQIGNSIKVKEINGNKTIVVTVPAGGCIILAKK